MARLKFTPHRSAAGADWARDIFATNEAVRTIVESISLEIQRAAPIKTIKPAYLSASEITQYFDSSGLGRAGSSFDGWAICNGNNGTPDLNGTFPRFETAAAGSTGGSDTNSHTHSISFTSGSESAHTHSTPNHSHSLSNAGSAEIRASAGTLWVGAAGANFSYIDKGTYTDTSGTGTVAGAALSGNTDSGGASTSGAGSSHSHSVSGTSAAPSDTENRPSFYGLVPVMRVS